jgi:tRNA(fMet)-specific endonuclease VapC
LNFHLDTNVVIGLLNANPEYRARYEQLRARGEETAVSSVVVFELWYGVARSKRVAQNARALRLFLETLVNVLPFTSEDAVAAGEIRASLKKTGSPIGPYDVLIAGQALRMGATLVTANIAEFERVRGLEWQDWSR